MCKIIAYLNPSCSKCRQTESILNKLNLNFDVIEYLHTQITRAELKELLDLGIPAKELIRTGEQEWSQTWLDIETASDDDLINAIIQYPILLQRPIVIANGKAVIARPPEKVLEIL